MVRKAIDFAKEGRGNAQVIAEDTDILVMLVYHYITCRQDIFMTTTSGTFSMKDIAENLSETERSRMLFIHSVTGCDTVSAIYGKGKQTLFKKLGNCQ